MMCGALVAVWGLGSVKESSSRKRQRGTVLRSPCPSTTPCHATCFLFTPFAALLLHFPAKAKLRIGLAEQSVLVALAHSTSLQREGAKGADLADRLEKAAQVGRSVGCDRCGL